MRSFIPFVCSALILGGCPKDEGEIEDETSGDSTNGDTADTTDTTNGDTNGDTDGETEGDDTALGKLTEALGGSDVIDGLTGLQLQGEGSRFIPNEGATPEDAPTEANTFVRTVAFDFTDDALRIDTAREILFLFVGPQEYTDIVRGNVGTTTNGFFDTPLGDIPSDKVASIRLQEMLLNPHVLLKSLQEDGFTEGADIDLEGVPHHRLTAEGPSLPLTLFINAEDGTLTKVETEELDFYRRDSIIEVTYSDWQTTTDGVGYPASVSLARGGDTLITQEVSDFTVNPTFEAGTFDFADDADPQLDQDLFDRGLLTHQWYYLLDSIGLPFTGVDISITPVELAPGVEQLQGGSHHSFVVEQAEGLVLVDAPLHEDRAQALIDYLAENYADKPIAYVVASHFHEDHVSGIRQILGAVPDAQLVVHESVEAFWRELLERPSTIAPDALEESPREVEIVTVPDDDSLLLDDEEHPVTLYDMNSPHAGDLIMPHEASSNTVFVVDIYSPGNAAQFGAAETDATIVDNGIPTDDLQIVGGHGAELHGYEDLQGFLEE